MRFPNILVLDIFKQLHESTLLVCSELQEISGDEIKSLYKVTADVCCGPFVSHDQVRVLLEVSRR